MILHMAWLKSLTDTFCVLNQAPYKMRCNSDCRWQVQGRTLGIVIRYRAWLKSLTDKFCVLNQTPYRIPIFNPCII